MLDALAPPSMNLAQEPSEPAPPPAALIESGIGLIRAEIALALTHARQVAVRAVSATLATIVACAFAQLTAVLLVLLPVLIEVVPVENAVISVASSAFLTLAFGGGAALAWARALRVRKQTGARAPKLSPPAGPGSGYDTQRQRGQVNLAERARQ